MGMMDDIKDKLGDNMDNVRDEYNELRSKEQAGQLDDKGREKLQQLRERILDKQ